jgi:predicted Zn-dependent protease
LFSHLINLATEQGQTDEALSLVEAGLKHDCEQNEGRRRNDYEFREAQVLLKAGEVDRAHDTFCRLIARIPSNLDVLGRATESMLSAKRPQQAAGFALQGLQQAKKQGDRDRIGYFEELLAASRK